jgi:hypothetical protein
MQASPSRGAWGDVEEITTKVAIVVVQPEIRQGAVVVGPQHIEEL